MRQWDWLYDELPVAGGHAGGCDGYQAAAFAEAECEDHCGRRCIPKAAGATEREHSAEAEAEEAAEAGDAEPGEGAEAGDAARRSIPAGGRSIPAGVARAAAEAEEEESPGCQRAALERLEKSREDVRDLRHLWPRSPQRRDFAAQGNTGVQATGGPSPQAGGPSPQGGRSIPAGGQDSAVTGMSHYVFACAQDQAQTGVLASLTKPECLRP